VGQALVGEKEIRIMLRTEKTPGGKSRKMSRNHPMTWGVGVFCEVALLQVKENAFVKRWVMMK
jgi:hypothetical protein